MSVRNFTVQFDSLASQSDFEDSGVDADIIPLVGEVRFVPLIEPGTLVLSPSYSPRPTGFIIRPFIGYLDSDGRLKNTKGGTAGLRLWANDPIFGLSSLRYRVDFMLRTPAGEPVEVKSGYFQAPSVDSTVNLAAVLTTA